MLDFIRIACAVPNVKPGDVQKNVAGILEYMARAEEHGVDLLVFPELAITGYTCGDLFYQETLHNAVDAGLRQILDCSQKHPNVTAVVGLPVRMGMQLANCAAVVSDGCLRGLVSKTYLADYGGSNESVIFDNSPDNVRGFFCAAGQTPPNQKKTASFTETVSFKRLNYLITSPMVPGAMPAALDSSVSMCIASA